MFLKPKSTQLNSPAKLFRRYNITKLSKEKVFYKHDNGSYIIFATYDDNLDTVKVASPTPNARIIEIKESVFFLNDTRKDRTLVVSFSSELNEIDVSVVNEPLYTLKNVFKSLENIGKYSANSYRFIGDFNYGIKGDKETAIGSPLGGLMTPLESFNIVVYDDIRLTVGDMVVIEGQLYSVESVNINIKRCPYPYTYQRATLNKIL